MRIFHNLMAENTTRMLGINESGSTKMIEKLSSGLKVNKAADDAAGLSISEKMRAQVKGLTMASKNAQDGISLIQTAEGALNEVHAMIQRLREIAVQGANDTNVSEDRYALSSEISQLLSAIDDVSDRTAFNGMHLLNGDFATDKLFHTGADSLQTLTITIPNLTLSGNLLTFLAGSTPSTTVQDEWETTISAFNDALLIVSDVRSTLGAIQNRLEYTTRNVENTAENLQAAESRIRDLDMAKGMAEFTKYNILNQASTAMLAQANQMPQGVLQLLQ